MLFDFLCFGAILIYVGWSVCYCIAIIIGLILGSRDRKRERTQHITEGQNCNSQ